MRTLRNAVEQGKVHHAYLFVGSRGTGKTSMAKILAACLNCERGPTIEPCGVCDSCVAIASASSLDVIEMDAASNNSVDDIRDLRDSVAYAPVSGRHKVYILDEAHMLSPQAWNAFLRTLEEPPPNTIFVLATTEAQKVLPTVVDRCHRFDFSRPTVEQLAAVISRVAGQEAIDIPAAAVALLARHATGSFRDALGTLEQLVTYSGRAVSTDDVLAVLGVADADLLFAALDAIGAHDARSALLAAARLASSGRDLSQVMRDVETHARELLVVQTLGEVPGELHITPDRDARLAEQSGRVGRSDLVRLLELLGDAMRAVKDGAEARTRLELALVEAASPQIDPSARALMARLERLEAALAAGGAPAPPAAPAPAAAAPSPPTAPAPAAAAPPPPAAPAPAPPAVAPPEAAPVPRPASAPPDPAPTASPHGDVTPEQASDPAPAATAVMPPPGAATIEALAGMWPAVLDSVRGENQLLGVALSEARPVELRDHELVVAFAEGDGFNRR
ncbi:MAG: polymerase subunit gamma/tau, partial [Solirubrobacteraceae bacterium]|nr:polymerase subunit gamma/tau [Solirubrobacteraceae bacterium]